MKRIFVFMAALMLLSVACSKDDEEEVWTSYYIQNNMPLQSSEIPYLDGTFYEVIAYCYDASGDIVREDQHINVPPDGGISNSEFVTDNIVKVVVSFKLLPRESAYYDISTNIRKYTVAKFVIERGLDNCIALSGSTTMSSSIAKSIEKNDLASTLKFMKNE